MIRRTLITAVLAAGMLATPAVASAEDIPYNPTTALSRNRPGIRGSVRQRGRPPSRASPAFRWMPGPGTRPSRGQERETWPRWPRDLT